MPSGDVAGASVLISPTVVLTANHVVDDSVHTSVLCGDKAMPGYVIRRDPANDLAIVALATPCGMPTVKLPTANYPLVPSGQRATYLGCPDGHCDWVIQGNVVGYDVVSYFPGQPRNVLVIDAPTWFGNSGGPVLDENGVLIGIASSIFKIERGPFQRIFSAAIPQETIIDFLAAGGVLP